jgi:hypothetical protein
MKIFLSRQDKANLIGIIMLLVILIACFMAGINAAW